MVRTQIQFTEEQARKVRRVARERGISMAEVIRRCIGRAFAFDVGFDAEGFELLR